MTPRELGIIQHALGCDQYGRNDHPRCKPGPEHYPYYRNHFCAGKGDEDDCKALVELGLMVQHETTTWLPYFNCSVTPAGIKAMRDESPAPPKLSRSQKRYRAWLDADCSMTFFEWMKYEMRAKREGLEA